MSINFATQKDITYWNNLILANPDGGNVFQGAEFAQQKKLGGWTPRYVVADNLAITILEKSVPGLGKLWYAPKGPGITTTGQLAKLLPKLKKFAASHGVFAVKIEPEIVKTSDAINDIAKLQLIPVNPIQPNFSTVTIDISDKLDTVMKHLNQKGRHAIKRADRDGVDAKLVEANDHNCQLMYRLLADTASASSFRIRSYSYYKTFWQRYADAGLGQLFFAYVDNQLVAAAYAMAFGTKSTYKDGASVRERPVYGASHLLQWRVIEWAKFMGSTSHDLCGAPPSDRIKDTSHSLYGVGRFKTSFNKHVTDYVGAYDMVVRPTAYKIWTKIGERAALSLHYRRTGESYY